MPPSPPPAPASASKPLVLVCGEDEFLVKERARQLYRQWCDEVGGMDHETIDAAVSNSGEALRSLGRLRAALQTLPFFGSAKVIWFKDCAFLGDDRTAESQAVTAALLDLAQELRSFTWTGVRLLVSAVKVDRRKTFYKTVEKLGTVEALHGLDPDDKDWMARAEQFVRQQLRALAKEMSDEAAGELITAVGPNLRQLRNEVEKAALHAGERSAITVGDITAVVSRNKLVHAFALGEALGDRDLPRVLRSLDEELWALKTDREGSVIGLLYGIIAKVRALLMLKELLAAGLVKPEADYSRFKTQLARAPSIGLPADKRYNPLAMNPYALFRALPQTARYSTDELVRAMGLLLACNQRLVSSGLEGPLVLQQTLVRIVGPPAPARSAAARAPRA